MGSENLVSSLNDCRTRISDMIWSCLPTAVATDLANAKISETTSASSSRVKAHRMASKCL